MLSTDRVRNIGAVILAAGRSERMGRSKALLPWGDQTLCGAWVDRFREAGVRDIVVVAGPELPVLSEAIDATFVQSIDPEQDGPRESLVLGLDALPSDTPAFFTPVDVPPVSADTLRALMNAYEDAAQPFAVVPQRKERTGHPVLAGPDLVKRIFEGERGDRVDELLAWATRRQVLVQIDDRAAFVDMNDTATYEKWAPR